MLQVRDLRLSNPLLPWEWGAVTPSSPNSATGGARLLTPHQWWMKFFIWQRLIQQQDLCLFPRSPGQVIPVPLRDLPLAPARLQDCHFWGASSRTHSHSPAHPCHAGNDLDSRQASCPSARVIRETLNLRVGSIPHITSVQPARLYWETASQAQPCPGPQRTLCISVPALFLYFMVSGRSPAHPHLYSL